MRKDTKFPMEGIFLLDFLRSAWGNGWLDEYSDDHFLIKTIENRLDDFVGKEQMIGNETNLQGIVKPDGGTHTAAFNSNFCINFSMHMQALERTFGTENIKRFMMDQMSAGKQKYDEDTFFQALSEVSILCFYARHDWTQALYEPPVSKGGSKKNPEASFMKELSGKGGETEREKEKIIIKVNVEVKSPEFPHDNHANEKTMIPAVLLTDDGRKRVKEFCAGHDLLYMDPRVLKLKEFIKSAAEKFTVPGPNEFNLLYINWSYRDFPSNSFLEPWSLLTNELNGILTHPEAAESIGISLDWLKKITAVIVYTESLEGLMFSDFRYVWQRHGAGPRFRMWVLNDELRAAEQNSKSGMLFRITGMKPDDALTRLALMDYKIKTDVERRAAHKVAVDLEQVIMQNAKVW